MASGTLNAFNACRCCSQETLDISTNQYIECIAICTSQNSTFKFNSFHFLYFSIILSKFLNHLISIFQLFIYLKLFNCIRFLKELYKLKLALNIDVCKQLSLSLKFFLQKQSNCYLISQLSHLIVTSCWWKWTIRWNIIKNNGFDNILWNFIQVNSSF